MTPEIEKLFNEAKPLAEIDQDALAACIVEALKDETRYECYDCEKSHEYSDADIYEYYDAEHGTIVAFTCKSCGLTNSF